jgi:hypothetical protein
MPNPVNIEKRVQQYVALRDHIRAIKERHKAELKAPNETLEKLNSVLLGHLNAIGGVNVGTAYGTVYKTTKKSASVADMSAFWTYVVSQGDFDMVDKRANPTAVEAYIEANGTTPPGVNWNVLEVVGVQRK